MSAVPSWGHHVDTTPDHRSTPSQSIVSYLAQGCHRLLIGLACIEVLQRITPRRQQVR